MLITEDGAKIPMAWARKEELLMRLIEQGSKGVLRVVFTGISDLQPS